MTADKRIIICDDQAIVNKTGHALFASSGNVSTTDCCGSEPITRCNCLVCAVPEETPCCMTITVPPGTNKTEFPWCLDCDQIGGAYDVTRDLGTGCVWEGTLCQANGTEPCCQYDGWRVRITGSLPWTWWVDLMSFGFPVASWKKEFSEKPDCANMNETFDLDPSTVVAGFLCDLPSTVQLEAQGVEHYDCIEAFQGCEYCIDLASNIAVDMSGVTGKIPNCESEVASLMNDRFYLRENNTTPIVELCKRYGVDNLIAIGASTIFALPGVCAADGGPIYIAMTLRFFHSAGSTVLKNNVEAVIEISSFSSTGGPLGTHVRFEKQVCADCYNSVVGVGLVATTTCEGLFSGGWTKTLLTTSAYVDFGGADILLTETPNVPIECHTPCNPCCDYLEDKMDHSFVATIPALSHDGSGLPCPGNACDVVFNGGSFVLDPIAGVGTGNCRDSYGPDPQVFCWWGVFVASNPTCGPERLLLQIKPIEPFAGNIGVLEVSFIIEHAANITTVWKTTVPAEGFPTNLTQRHYLALSLFQGAGLSLPFDANYGPTPVNSCRVDPSAGDVVIQLVP